MNPPVPRRLVTQSPVPGNLPPVFPETFGPLPRTGLGSKFAQVRTDPSASVQLCKILFRLLSKPGQAQAQ